MKFPDFPEVKGKWHSLSMTPIMHSGESITVAVVAVTESGDWKVKSAISDKLYEVAFPNTGMRNMVSLHIESIERWLESGNSLDSWQPTLEGFTLGDSREAADNSINDIVEQGLRSSSFLYRQQ